MRRRTDVPSTAQRLGQTLGHLLRGARLRCGQSLREIASQAGITPAYLSLLERDGCGPPNDDKLQRLANVLGESDAELFAKAGRVTPRAVSTIIQNPTQWTDLLEAARGLGGSDLERLKKGLLAVSHHGRRQTFGQGSAAAGTRISPPTEIDLLYAPQPESHYARTSRPTPSQLKAIVEAAQKEEEKIQKSRPSMCEGESVR